MQAVIIIAILLDLEITHSPLNDSFILTSLEMFVYLNYQHSHYMIIWLSLKTVAAIWVYFPFWKLSVPMKSQYKYSQMYLRYRYTSTDKQDAILMFIYKFRLTKKVFEFMTSCTSGNKYSSEPHQLMLRLGLIPPKAEMLQPPCFTQSLHWLRNRRAFDGQTEMSLPV